MQKFKFPGNLFTTSIIFFSAAILLGSCASTSKNTDYFQTIKGDTVLRNFASNDFQNTVQIGDRLSIKASSLNQTEDAIFNQAGSASQGSGGVSSTGGFLVGQNGKIELHRLGQLQAAGLTKNQLAVAIKKQLEAYMKDVVVEIGFLNHKITVLGAVNSPQVIQLVDEQMPIIDALVLSGNVKEGAKTDEVMVIREEGNEKKVKYLNLQDASLFKSEWYYARPNDIIYVKNDLEKKNKEERQNSLRTTLSLIASGVGLLIIILDRIIK